MPLKRTHHFIAEVIDGFHRALPSCRLSWLFANILVIGGEKSQCIVYEHLLIFYALLRDFYYTLGDYFAHGPRVRGPSELTSRLFDPRPRFIESMRDPPVPDIFCKP